MKFILTITMALLATACLRPDNITKIQSENRERIVEVKNEDAEAVAFGFTFSELPSFVGVDSPELVIEYMVNNPDPEGSFDLYLTQSKDNLAGARSLHKDVALVSGSLTWDTSQWPSGSYFIVARIKQRDIHSMNLYDKRIVVDSILSVENQSPYGQIDEPRIQRLYLAQNPPVMRFRTTDLDGDDYSTWLERRCDGRAEWEVVAADLPPGTEEYQLSIPADQPPWLCEFQLRLRDTEDNEVTAPQGGMFAISGGDVTYDPLPDDDTQGGQMRALFTAKCAACHSGATPTANFDVETYEDVGTIRGVRSRSGTIVRYTALPIDDPKHMPPAGQPQLTPEELRLIQVWNYGGRD